jgi:hypothetical protein
MRSFRLLVLLLAGASVWLGTGSAVARASVCVSAAAQTTTGRVCIASIRPEGGTPVSPVPGHVVAVHGRTTVTATVTYSPAAVPRGEVRGCGGERKTPSGCLTWYVNGSYTLTHLYPTSGSSGTYTYTWVWSTQQYPNGARTLSAQINVNGRSTQADVPVSVSNAVPGVLHSPVANGGRLPNFTAGALAQGFRIAAVGDGPSGSAPSRAVAEMINRFSPNAVMYLGDVYQRGMKDEFLNFYQPLYGFDWARTIPVIGNHEYQQLADGGGYFWYWNYPHGSPTVAHGGGGWYSLNAGGWHIIGLNSVGPMSHEASSPQANWLAADLAADRANRPLSTKPCTLAFFHHPRFSDISLRKPSTSSLWNQLYPYGTDVIVNAHSHVYERWRPLTNAGSATDAMHGITEFVVGTGWQTNDPRSAFRQNTRWGALLMTLYRDHMHFQYWAAKTGSATSQTLLDAGDIPCHGSPLADTGPPHIATPPSVQIPAAGTEAARIMSTAGPVQLRWIATDNAGTANLSYQIQRTCDGGLHWATVAGTTEMNAVRWALRARTCQFRVRAIDGSGNASGWSASPPLHAVVRSEDGTGVSHPEWFLGTSPLFDGRHARYAFTAGSTATYTFIGRNVGWVAGYSALRGAAVVSIDGEQVATVSLSRATSAYKRIVFARNWAEAGRHTIAIRVVGTAGHPRVDLDGFLHLSPMPRGSGLGISPVAGVALVDEPSPGQPDAGKPPDQRKGCGGAGARLAEWQPGLLRQRTRPVIEERVEGAHQRATSCADHLHVRVDAAVAGNVQAMCRQGASAVLVHARPAVGLRADDRVVERVDLDGVVAKTLRIRHAHVALLGERHLPDRGGIRLELEHDLFDGRPDHDRDAVGVEDGVPVDPSVAAREFLHRPSRYSARPLSGQPRGAPSSSIW